MTSMHEEIARRAYDLYLSRGAGHGLDLEDWLEAERQVTMTTEGPVSLRIVKPATRRSRPATRSTNGRSARRS